MENLDYTSGSIVTGKNCLLYGFTTEPVGRPSGIEGLSQKTIKKLKHIHLAGLNNTTEIQKEFLCSKRGAQRLLKLYRELHKIYNERTK